MSNDKFITDLGKVLIAAAWADGQISAQEINCLKDLIWGIEELTAEQWATLEIYMDSPIDPQERQQLLANLVDSIKTKDQKETARSMIGELITADGILSEDEIDIAAELISEVETANVGAFSSISRMIKGALGKRKDDYAKGTQRDEDVEDYLRNTIYYQLKRYAEVEPVNMGLTEDKVRQLCLAAGLMGHIAYVDQDISQAERDTIAAVLIKFWQLNEAEATLVAEIACLRTIKGLDYHRLTRGFYSCTNRDQRRLFLACLFAVANASEKTDHYEQEEIRRISESLKLSHDDFIAAKCTISDEDLGLA